MIEHVIAAVAPCVSSLMIIANNDDYQQFGYPVFRDVIPECGPMGGIYTGLLHSATANNIVVSCDIPFITPALISQLVSAPDESDVVCISHSGKSEPLCARYRKSCALKLISFIEAGNLKMREFLSSVSTELSNAESIPGFDKMQLANINTPLELKLQSTLKT
jgi:molybdopterin-guanine dinucleotide biosynthesis protein A